jgi:hypothetical protein
MHAFQKKLDSYRPTFTLPTITNTTYYLLMVPSFEVTFSLMSVPPNETANNVCLCAIPMVLDSTFNANFTFATLVEDAATDNCFPGPTLRDRPGLWYTFQGNGDQVAIFTGEVRSYTSVYRRMWRGHTHVCGRRQFHHEFDCKHKFRNLVLHVGQSSR